MNVSQAGHVLRCEPSLDFCRDCRVLHVRFSVCGIRMRILGGSNHRAAEKGGEDCAACRKIGFHDSSILVNGPDYAAPLQRLPFATARTRCTKPLRNGRRLYWLGAARSTGCLPAGELRRSGKEWCDWLSGTCLHEGRKRRLPAAASARHVGTRRRRTAQSRRSSAVSNVVLWER